MKFSAKFRLTIWESLRAAARAITPDMSRPELVRLFSARLSAVTPLCLRPSHSAVMPSVVNVPKPLRSIPQSWLSCKLSSRKCAFPAMQVPMMMADAISSFLPERSIDSMGLMPFSSSMGRGWPSTLSEASALQQGSALASSSAPCALSWLPLRLSETSALHSGSALASSAAPFASRTLRSRLRDVMLLCLIPSHRAVMPLMV
mmetsp:Transcript_37279/g.98870  ORF Transcript_37279/g.98870 Transcript_37279/m.98870 type:complete len:203 (-) Transcript_37279:1473-2081(-)